MALVTLCAGAAQEEIPPLNEADPLATLTVCRSRDLAPHPPRERGQMGRPAPPIQPLLPHLLPVRHRPALEIRQRMQLPAPPTPLLPLCHVDSRLHLLQHLPRCILDCAFTTNLFCGHDEAQLRGAVLFLEEREPHLGACESGRGACALLSRALSYGRPRQPRGPRGQRAAASPDAAVASTPAGDGGGGSCDVVPAPGDDGGTDGDVVPIAWTQGVAASATTSGPFDRAGVNSRECNKIDHRAQQNMETEKRESRGRAVMMSGAGISSP